jgi:CcmD family protein
MDNLSYLCAAFSVVWVGLFAYILLIVQRQRSIRRDIDWLKETLKNKKEAE